MLAFLALWIIRIGLRQGTKPYLQFISFTNKLFLYFSLKRFPSYEMDDEVVYACGVIHCINSSLMS